MNAKDFVIQFGSEIKKYIAYYENFKELEGAKKRDRVVDVLEEWIEKNFANLPINPVIGYIVKKVVLAVLPHIVQVAFDLIKSKVEGITE